MADLNKSEAVDFASTIRKLYDALIAEGFDDCFAKDLLMSMYKCALTKPTIF